MRVGHVYVSLVLACAALHSMAAPPERARDLGVPFEGVAGPLNAITDVPGVEVGQITLISGAGKLEIGKGPVRSGVTVIFPLGKKSDAAVQAGFFNLNGNGEMTAQSYLQDFGVAYGPIGITNTNARCMPAYSNGLLKPLAARSGRWWLKPGTAC